MVSPYTLNRFSGQETSWWTSFRPGSLLSYTAKCYSSFRASSCSCSPFGKDGTGRGPWCSFTALTSPRPCFRWWSNSSRSKRTWPQSFTHPISSFPSCSSSGSCSPEIVLSIGSWPKGISILWIPQKFCFLPLLRPLYPLPNPTPNPPPHPPWSILIWTIIILIIHLNQSSPARGRGNQPTNTTTFIFIILCFIIWIVNKNAIINTLCQSHIY